MKKLTSIVYTVTDLDAAKAVHTALLGTESHTDTPYYVGFNLGGVEIALTPHVLTAGANVAAMARELASHIEFVRARRNCLQDINGRTETPHHSRKRRSRLQVEFGTVSVTSIHKSLGTEEVKWA